MHSLLNRRTFLSSTGLGVVSLALPFGAACQVGIATGIRLEDHGGRAEPGHDNGEPLRRAFAAAAASRVPVLLGPGSYEVAALPLLRQGAILRPPGVALIGAGSDRSAIRIVGRSIINHLFSANDSTEVLTRGIRLIGNGVTDDTAPYAGGLMIARLSAAAQADMTGILFESCDIENFGAAAWFHLENQSPRRRILRSGSRGCNWHSRRGNCPTPGEITVPGHFIYFRGEVGPIEDVIVDDGLMDATHIKGGVGAVGNVDGGRISIATLRGAGQAISSLPSGPDGPGAYAILLYQTPRSQPRNLVVSIDHLEDPYSCGVYLAGARGIEIRIGRAHGQRDVRDGTLFKGILALLGGRDLTATIDEVEDCNRVVMISLDGGQNLGREAENVNVRVHVGRLRSRAGAHDFTIDLGATAWAGGITVTGQRTGPAAVAVHLRASDDFGLQDIDLSGLISSGARTPLAIGSTASPKMRRIRPPRQ